MPTLHPAFDDAARRFEAWWVGEVLDRPVVSLRVDEPAPHVPSTHGSLRDRWLDADWQVQRADAQLEARTWLGDSVPSYNPNVGPEVTATLLGAELAYGEHTAWATPIVHDVRDWQAILDRPLAFDNPVWQAMERMTDLAIARSAGRYLVGITDLHGAYDILAGLREPELLCLDMIDEPELVQRAAMRAAEAMVAAFERLYAKVAAAGMGSTCWTPFYHAGPAYVASCDFWCMLSPDMARQHVMPTIERELDPLERSIFHLDGPQALRHLDLLLQLPHDRLQAIQWVFGAGNGPAARWLDVYRRCRAAAKCVQVIADDADDALAVLDAIGPEGTWLCVGRPFASVADAEAFLRTIEKRVG